MGGLHVLSVRVFWLTASVERQAGIYSLMKMVLLMPTAWCLHRLPAVISDEPVTAEFGRHHQPCEHANWERSVVPCLRNASIADTNQKHPTDQVPIPLTA